VVSAVILVVAAAVIVPFLAGQNRRKNAEDTRAILFSLSTSLSNPHYCTAVFAPPCPALPATSRAIGYTGFMQKVVVAAVTKYPQNLHALTNRLTLVTEKSCNGTAWVAADTVAWNPTGAAPGLAGQWAPYSGLTIVTGRGAYTPLGWVHDSVLKSTTGAPSIAGWVELHIDSLSVDDVNELDLVIDGSVNGAAGLLRFAPNGSYQLARFLISAPVNAGVTKGC
jgi:hypothetical protein